MVCCLGSFFLTFREMFVPDNLNQSALLWLQTVMSLSVQVKLKQNVKWRHFFCPWQVLPLRLGSCFSATAAGSWRHIPECWPRPWCPVPLSPRSGTGAGAREVCVSVSHTDTHIYFSSSFSPPSLCTSLPKTGSLSPSPASVPSSSSSRCWAECWFSEDPRCWPAEHASQTCSRRGEKKTKHIIPVEKKLKRKLNILKLAEK